jgi:repressor LexA
MNITPRQQEVLRFIKDFTSRKGYSPSLEEIAAHLGVRKVTVFHLLGRLERSGVIRRRRYRARSIVLTPPKEEDALPLKGRIAAGAPIEAVEAPDTIRFSDMFPSHRGRYVLRVQGDSMIEEHICDGDYVIVQPRPTAENGEVVVALLDNGEATLKRFYREQGRIRLQPANPHMKPVYVEDVKVLGVVMGVLRKF